MENKIIKIHYDNKVYLSFLFIFLFGIGVLIAKYTKKENCIDADFDMIALTFTTGDLIEFKSIGDDGYKWEWDFGDRTEKEFVSNTLHKYDSVGMYNITLKINNSCVVNKQLYIRDKVYVKKTNGDGAPEMKFTHKEIRVGDVVSFECPSKFATKWEWRFGESDEINAISQETTYVFDEEGEYKISLVVNDDIENALIKTITVYPKSDERRRVRRRRTDYIDGVLLGQIPDDPDEEIPGEEDSDMVVFSRKDAQKMLENYALGKIDFEDIKHNFCSNNIRVINTSGKISSLKKLLNAIRAKQIKIIDVNLYKNEKTGCVKTMNVDLKIKGTFFWKRY